MHGVQPRWEAIYFPKDVWWLRRKREGRKKEKKHDMISAMSREKLSLCECVRTVEETWREKPDAFWGEKGKKLS